MVPSLNESDDYIYDAPPVTRTVVNSKHRQHDSHGDNLIEYSNYPDHWEQDGGHGRQLWTPIWLRRTALVVFAVAFALMSLATGLLYHFSQVNNGISSQHEFNHYGWKYGPTACEISPLFNRFPRNAWLIFHSARHLPRSVGTGRFLQSPLDAVARASNDRRFGPEVSASGLHIPTHAMEPVEGREKSALGSHHVHHRPSADFGNRERRRLCRIEHAS